MKMRRGFTLIEVLVVVAIISILAIVVLFNVASYINKGRNAGIKSNLSDLLTNATVYFGNSGTFENFCSSKYFIDAQDSIHKSGGVVSCWTNANYSSFCSCSTLKKTNEEPAGSTVCVDASGYKKVTQNIGSCEVRCTNDGVCFD